MGQNQSTRTPREEIKGPPPRPAERPTSRLLSDLGPKGPSYYNPANCVLPSALTGLKDVQLRPVSKELSQYHPDFKDIFSSPDSNDNDINSGNVTSNGDISNEDLSNDISNGHDSSEILSSSYPGVHSSPLANGLPFSTAYGNGGTTDNGTPVQSASGKLRGHRRQMSATSSLYIRETIPEDPNEESLDIRGKIDPISMDTSYTSQVSIPVKSSFDLDQSYNMTYAQLAEARRSKTLMDIEKRTGKKLEDLSHDLADNAEEGSFSRQPSLRSMKSAVSLDTGLKKKKRAPPPPSHPPPQPPTSTPQKTSSSQPPPRPAHLPQKKAHSFEEPPADYDMDGVDNSPVKRSHSLRTPVAPPPPPPATKSILKKSGISGPNRSNSQPPQSAIQTTAHSAPTTPRSTSMYKSPPVLPPAAKANQSNPFLMEIQKRAEKISMRRQLSEQTETEKKASENQSPVEEPAEKVEELNFTDISKAEDEPNLVYQSAPVTPRETQDKYSPKPPPLVRQSSIDSGVVESTNTNFETRKPVEVLQRQPSETSTTSGVSSNDSNNAAPATRKLSSLLQHDIKIAAQAKATKMVKHTTPVKEKPKDPAQVFREQLQRAAAEREARCKEGKTIDSQLAEQKKKEQEQEENLLFKSDTVTVKRSESTKENREVNEIKDSEKDNEEKEEFPRPKFVKKSSNAPSGLNVRNSRQRQPDSDEEDASKSYRDSVYGTNDWVPEDDLSDDNLSDDQTMTSPRNGMEGFKTSIIPQKVKDLKTKGKAPKVKEKKYKKNSDSSADERRKFDSIKKFKKSVHKSVRNAFGSISKASGKIMKKQKSEDFEVIQDVPRNWKLTASHSEPSFDRMMMSNGLEEREDSSDDDESSVLESSVSESHSSHKASESNGRGDDERSDDDDDEDNEDNSKEHDISTMKRAGVAYVNKKGQIVLLPEYESVNGHGSEHFEGSAPKLIPKKKKFTYDATVRRKEREMKEEIISKDVHEKEKQREEEKQKEKETELEFRRLRELEARDRLQRLELQAQMQQQLLQQQQQQLGFLSAPPLPPPTQFQQGYNPAAFEFSNMMPQPGLQQGGMGLPYTGQPTFSGPLFNAGVPGMSYDLTDYMRMMQGMQPNQNMTSAYAFMMNGQNWPGTMMDVNKGLVDYSKMPNGNVQTDDSQRNQVYKTWQGPTKQVVPNPNAPASGTAQKYMVPGDHPTSQQYHSNGAIDPSVRGDDSNSDASVSEGLSPLRSSMVAKIKVGDFRPSVKENNAGLFKSSISVPNLSTSKTNGDFR